MTEEDDLACDDEYVTWVVNQNVIGRGIDLNADTTLGRIHCCGGGNPACDKHWAFTDICGDRCDWTEGGGSGAGDVFSQNYGVLWTDLCAGNCTLLIPSGIPGVISYDFANEILCETTWKRCDDPLPTCYTYNSREYACTGAIGGMTWDNCTAAGKNCVGGACVAVSGLALTASASPTAINVGATSTITFIATKSSVGVAGATVSGISVSAGGGTVSANSCTTFLMGECSVTYTAPAGSTVATITATKATKVGETDSGSASAIVTVASADWECSPLGPDYADTCTGFPVTDMGSCASLNGAGPGCAGVWQNCGSLGCDAGCNGACGTCVTKYQACKCSCGGAATCNNDGVANNGETGVDCGGGGCDPCAVCSPNGCNNDCPANCDGHDDPDCAGACLDPSCGTDMDCCTNTPCIAPQVCNTTSGVCVDCLIHADCAGTDVCSNNVCIPCTGEGNTPASFDISLCCAGLDLWDKDGTGTPVCTSACNPTIGFYCNTLRGSVDNIAQAGEQLIGYILGIIGSVALLLIIIAGIMYMTAAGVEEKITSAKRILSGAVIGLGIALLAFSLLQVIMTVLNM